MAESPLQSEVSLPTLEKLKVKLPENIDPQAVAAAWLQAFSKAVESGHPSAVVDLFLPDGLWRDMLALTWDFRTIHGATRIRKLLEARLAETKPTAFRLCTDKDKAPASTVLPDPALVWVQGFFEFETAIGSGSGIFRIVPAPNGEWKAHVVYTNLESLRGMPAKVGPLRNHESHHGPWHDQRARELSFEESDPKVLIVGAGHSGLDVAARLKYWDIPSLVVDKNPRIGDGWRNRYHTLSLHDPVWADHMPYLNFPLTWPVFSPAHKLADWLESYAHALELNIWTSTELEFMERDESSNVWVAKLRKPDGSIRIMRPKHVVFAFGLAGNQIHMPKLPGMNDFQGRIIHSSAYKDATDFIGKKVAVVGSCTSAHDICQDLQNQGVDVTMIQRSSTCVISAKSWISIFLAGLYAEEGPPVDLADRIGASYPHHLLKLLHQGVMKQVIENEKETLQGLEKAGFKLNYGVDGSGPLLLAWGRLGGFYLDTGASQLIIDGKIKLKGGSVKSMVKNGLVFEDGSLLDAEAAVFATGFGDARDAARKLIGDELAANMPPIWGLDEEGEIQSVWRERGIPNLYIMMGNLALCRFHSTHVALQIKAKDEGLYTTQYAG